MQENHPVHQQIVKEYLRRTPTSCVHDQRAKISLPGGDTRWATYYLPYPVYMQSGKGCVLTDADGNTYRDFQNNYTVLVHGHRPLEVMKAVKQELERDIITGAPSQSQYILSELLAERIPGVDTLRYTNSGTEATMMAMRTARAVTGRELILKFDGGYHGTHDFAQVSIKPSLDTGRIEARVENRSIPSIVLQGVRVARFNDIASVEEVMQQWGDQVAGVIIEPVMNTAGIIPASVEFLARLRELCDAYKSLLIFDEIVTLRLSRGGFQQLCGVIPDITVLGKIIGGGFAVGAYGGSRELMDIYNPAGENTFQHSGTFNGHPVAMAAGSAALRALTDEKIEGINRLGGMLKEGIDTAFKDAGLYGHATRSGSLLYVQWCREEIRDASDVVRWKMHAGELPRMLHMGLLNKGIFIANRGLMNISTPMEEEDIRGCIDAFRLQLDELLPYVEAHTPHLLRREKWTGS